MMMTRLKQQNHHQQQGEGVGSSLSSSSHTRRKNRQRRSLLSSSSSSMIILSSCFCFYLLWNVYSSSTYQNHSNDDNNYKYFADTIADQFLFSITTTSTASLTASKTSTTNTNPSLPSSSKSSSSSKSNNNRCKCVDCVEDEHCGGLWKGTTVAVLSSNTTTTTSTNNKGGDPNNYFEDGIHLVISHCAHNLHWLSEFTSGYTSSIRSITIVSKCGKEVVGAPTTTESTTVNILRLPNVGRCDHTYAYYISNYVLPNYKTTPSKNTNTNNNPTKELHVFLKDDRRDESIHIPGYWRSLDDMIRIAASSTGGGGGSGGSSAGGSGGAVSGFACGMELTDRVYRARQRDEDNQRIKTRLSLSIWHSYNKLRKYSLKKYTSKIGGAIKYSNITTAAAAATAATSSGGDANNVNVEFKSGHENLESWWKSMVPNDIFNYYLHTKHKKFDPLIQVCYGGSFAATTERILLPIPEKRHNSKTSNATTTRTNNIQSVTKVWEDITTSLSRADNLEEGHFMERTWGALLSQPLESYQERALQDFKSKVLDIKGSLTGTLVRQQQSLMNN